MQGLSPTPPRPQGKVEIDPNRPAYKIVEKRGFFDETDRLWEQGKMIYWDGEPNPGFEPLNQMAFDKMREYLIKLDENAERVAKEKGVGYASMVNAFDAKRMLTELEKSEEETEVNGFKPVNVMRGENKLAMAAEEVGASFRNEVPLMRGKNKKERDAEKNNAKIEK